MFLKVIKFTAAAPFMFLSLILMPPALLFSFLVEGCRFVVFRLTSDIIE